MRATRQPPRPPPGLGWLDIHPTHYQTLSLTEDATPEQLAALPMPGPADDAHRRLAHAVLSDQLRRAVYDAWLARERAGLAATAGRNMLGLPRCPRPLPLAATVLILVIALAAAACLT